MRTSGISVYCEQFNYNHNRSLKVFLGSPEYDLGLILTGKHFIFNLFTKVNNIKRNVLLIIAEWLEEWQMPPLISRDQFAVEPEDINRILAIVGPRRAGKTYFMYQLIQSFLQNSRYSSYFGMGTKKFSQKSS